MNLVRPKSSLPLLHEPTVRNNNELDKSTCISCSQFRNHFNIIILSVARFPNSALSFRVSAELLYAHITQTDTARRSESALCQRSDQNQQPKTPSKNSTSSQHTVTSDNRTTFQQQEIKKKMASWSDELRKSTRHWRRPHHDTTGLCSPKSHQISL
jgi:hypothetical protein